VRAVGTDDDAASREQSAYASEVRDVPTHFWFRTVDVNSRFNRFAATRTLGLLLVVTVRRQKPSPTVAG
jgi:hypothetical protein